jgi:hypothetical protein
VDAITRFNLRGIARHTKGLVKHLLGLTRPITQEELERSTAAWHQPPDPGHPIELCQCVDKMAPPDMHNEGCPWAAAMCRTCHGDGYCPNCMGDGTEPKAPSPDLVEVP